ncbi:MAG: hypothetical protein HYX63_11350 [Gammaproteobacteria bacterium]|nr:hypothetical protein [Gammaproteobacteria bacterium]
MRRTEFVVGFILVHLLYSNQGFGIPISSNLNFATVNQSLWGPGDARIVNEDITLPPPSGVSATLKPGAFRDPTSALAHFLGVDVGVNVSPTASFSTGLSGHFHANSGLIDLNYPRSVQLTLPEQVQAGHSFLVSAALPGPVSLSNFTHLPSSALTSTGGGGYAAPGLSKLLTSSVGSAFQPTPGFSTVFPYAEARVELDLHASGGITAEGCLIFCISKTFNLGSVNLHQQLFELSTLNGLKVLEQPVVPFNQTIDVAQGVSIAFKSPNVALDGVLRSNQSLSDTKSQNFLDVSFNVGQLIPFVGQLLQSNVGPFGYDLLSVTPTVSLGIRQSITFDPKLMVDLQFATPVFDNRDGQLKNNVVFQVGQSVDLTPTIGTVLGGGPLTVKPTYFLDNTIHNKTDLVLNGTLDVKSLEFDTPFKLGPVFDTRPPIDLGSIPLAPLVDQFWTLAIPPISGPSQSIARTGVPQQLLQDFHIGVDPSGSTNSQGHSLFDLFSGNSLFATAFGDVRRTGNGFGCNGLLIENPINCQTLFVADQDVVTDLGGNLGKLFCLTCRDFSQLFLPTSPVLTDGVSGQSIFLSDLNSFPQLPLLNDLLNPASSLFDPILANSQYFQELTFTRSSIVSNGILEPNTSSLLLLACIMLGLKRGKHPRVQGYADLPRRIEQF